MKKQLLLILTLIVAFKVGSQEKSIGYNESVIFPHYVPYNPMGSPHVSCVDIADLLQNWDINKPDVVYVLSNQVLVTYVYPLGNQLLVYVQDASGGLLLVSGLRGPLSPFVKPGESLSGLNGYLTLRQGNLTLIPVDAPDQISSGNVINPLKADVGSLMQNPAMYESSLVRLDNVTVNGGGDLFETNKQYIIYQQSYTTALQTSLPEADYIGTPIPEAPFNLVGVVNYNHQTGELTVTPRSLNDISYDYANNKSGSWVAEDIVSSDGYIKIRSLVRQEFSVFTVLGQLIFQDWVDPGLSEVYLPTGGVYVVKLGKLVKKIVIP